MAKTLTGKRLTLEVKFYWRGKRKTPSMVLSVGDDEFSLEYGLPEDRPEFDAFYKAADALCKSLVKSGDLD